MSPAATARPTGDVLLYLNGVTVSFDGFKALNELSLVVEEGELRTIIGPNDQAPICRRPKVPDFERLCVR